MSQFINLFSNNILFATSIYPGLFINEIIQYCIDECSNGFMLPLLFLGFFINIIIYSSLTYTLLFLIKGIISSKLSQYFSYPQYFNILIRFIPFGYIFTSISTIVRGNTYWKGLGKEILYSVGSIILYILVAYYLYFFR